MVSSGWKLRATLYERCALTTKSAHKSAQNKINILSTSKNVLLNLYKVYGLLEHTPLQKHENPKLESSKKSKKKKSL